MNPSTLVLVILACSLLPLTLLSWLATLGGRGPRPIRWVVTTFVAGMFAAGVAFFAFEALDLLPAYRNLLSSHVTDDVVRAVFAIGVVGPVEEVLKLAAVVLSVGRSRRRFHPFDGFLFGAASSLGFAAAENWYSMYANSAPDAGRAAIVPFTHLLFTSFIGWGLARSIAQHGRSAPVYLGIVLAAVYHGLYDLLEFRGGWWHFATMPIVLLLWVFLTRTVKGLATAVPADEGTEDSRRW